MSDKKSVPILLVASLCVNALLIGAVGAGFVAERGKAHTRFEERRLERMERRPPDRGPMEERLARAAIDTLPDAERRKLRKAFAEEWRTTYKQREEMKAARETLRAAYLEDPIDRTKIESLLADIRAQESQMRERMQLRLVDILESLPAETRRDLVEQIQARGDDRREKFRDKVKERFRERMQEQDEN